MKTNLEYDVPVRRSILASVAVFGMTALLAVPGSKAQINGAPASVTSPGFGGRAINGPRASVTSVGPLGYAPGPDARFGVRRDRDGNHDGDHTRRRHNDTPAYLYAFPVPYAVDLNATEQEQDTEANPEDADDQGGPTVFDRRGSGEASYVAPKDGPPTHRERNETVAVADPPMEPTVLIFKDGHKLEVENYAIQGATLFDLTLGHARKIPLADLDLDATRRQNDDRGVPFEIPASAGK